MSWLAPAIVAIMSGSVILAAVFLYLYSREREPWMGVWGVAWLAYTVRFGVELYQAASGSPALGLVVVNNLLVLATGVLLLDGTYLLSGARVPRWHRYLALGVAVWTCGAALLALPVPAVSSPAWVFRGVANIAAGIVWYRHVSGTGPWAKITGVSFVVWGLHNLDYPFLRGVAAVASLAFMLGAFLEFTIAFGALIAYFERTRTLLRESETRYRAMFEGAESVMFIVDPVDSAIVDANAAAARFYGWTRDELRKMAVSDINTLSPEQIRSEMSSARTHGRAHFTFQHRVRSGEIRDVEVYSGPIDVGGRELLYSIVHDVTDRAHAERELRASEERYSTLFEDSLSPMLIVSTEDARLLDANSAAARMYGRSVPELLEMRISDLTDDASSEVEREVAATVADGGRVRNFRHRRSDGSVFDVEIYSTPIVSESRTVLYTIVNDISARVEAQRELAEYQQHLEELVAERTTALSRANVELERASRAKDEYLANMSHELRTPLNSVIGFSELLTRGMAGELNEEQQRQVAMINESGQHLLRVVDGLLDLARISAGAVEVNFEAVDVSRLCQDMAERIAPMIETRSIELRTAIASDVTISSDPVLLEQVLWNLLGNAAKFTEAGSVTLELTADDDRAVIVVRDTGRGVHPDDQWRVFEMFVRIEDERGARSDGTGLGLPISKRLVDVLGGTIEFESELGTGSTFKIRLPVNRILAS